MENLTVRQSEHSRLACRTWTPSQPRGSFALCQSIFSVGCCSHANNTNTYSQADRWSAVTCLYINILRVSLAEQTCISLVEDVGFSSCACPPAEFPTRLNHLHQWCTVKWPPWAPEHMCTWALLHANKMNLLKIWKSCYYTHWLGMWRAFSVFSFPFLDWFSVSKYSERHPISF